MGKTDKERGTEWKLVIPHGKPRRHKKQMGKRILSAVLAAVTAVVAILQYGFYDDTVFAAEKDNMSEREADLQIDKAANIKSVENNYGNFRYEILEDGTIAITEFTDSDATEVEIPKEIQGKKVTKIGNAAFGDCINPHFSNVYF